MKKTLLTLALVVTTVAAFAQGRVTFVNDSAHLFVLGTALAQDSGGGGTNGSTGAIPPGPLPSGVTLVAGLYAGLATDNMTLQTSTTPLIGTGVPSPGRMASRVTVLPFAGGSQAFYQIVIFDMNDPSPKTNPAFDGQAGLYWGASPIFQATASTSAISAPSIMPGSPANSTLAAQLNIVVNAVPEPSSFALAGLGLASLLIFRRRK